MIGERTGTRTGERGNITSEVAQSNWIGIPDPDFGATIGNPITCAKPDRPADWSSPVTGFFYVNYQTGTDSLNPYGSETTPRATIPDPIPPGGFVEVHGTYNYSVGGKLRINANGTSAAPCWVVAQDAVSRPTFTGSDVLAFGSYLFVDGIYIQYLRVSCGSASPGYPADHMCFRNCEAEGYGSNSDQINGTTLACNGDSLTDTASYIVYYNNTIHTYGDPATPEGTDYDCHLTGTGEYCNNIWFLNNHGYDATGAGMQINGMAGSSADRTHHIYAAGNTFHDVRQAGLWVKYGQDVIFSQNHVYNITLRGGKGLGGQYQPRRIWYLYNHIHDVDCGIRTGSNTAGSLDETTFDIYIIGNLIYNINTDAGWDYTDVWTDAGISLQGGYNRYIVNNTIFDAPAGIYGSSTNGTYMMYGNNISHLTEPLGNHVWIYGVPSVSELQQCVLYEPSAAIRIRWGSSTYDLAGFQSATSKGQNCSDGDPAYVSTITPDLHITAGSASDGRSSKHAAYDTFQSLYGLDIWVDYDNNARPASAADAGCYEL